MVVDRGDILAGPVPPLPKDMTEQALKDLQAEVRELLGGIADYHGARQTATFSAVRVDVHYSVIPAPPLVKPAEGIMLAKGATRDVTLVTLIHLLAAGDTKPIRRCPECPEHRLFYRVRRQKYCSRACVNRANKRAWRTAHSSPQQSKRKIPIKKKGATQ